MYLNNTSSPRWPNPASHSVDTPSTAHLRGSVASSTSAQPSWPNNATTRTSIGTHTSYFLDLVDEASTTKSVEALRLDVTTGQASKTIYTITTVTPIDDITFTESAQPQWRNAATTADLQATYTPLAEPVDASSSMTSARPLTPNEIATEQKSANYTPGATVQLEVILSTSKTHIMWQNITTTRRPAIYFTNTQGPVATNSSITPVVLLVPNQTSAAAAATGVIYTPFIKGTVDGGGSSAEIPASTFASPGSSALTILPLSLSSTPSVTSVASNIFVSHAAVEFTVESKGPANLIDAASPATPLQTSKPKINGIIRVTITNVIIPESTDGSGNAIFSTAPATQDTASPPLVTLPTPSQATTIRSVDPGVFTTYPYWTTVFVTTTANPAGTSNVTAVPELSTSSLSQVATPSTGLSTTSTTAPIPGLQTPSPSASEHSTSRSEIAGIAASISLAFIFIIIVLIFHLYQKRRKHPFKHLSIARESEKPVFFPKRDSFWRSSEPLESKWPSKSTLDENGIVWPEKVHLTGEAKWIHDMTLEWNHVDRYRRKMKDWPTSMTDIMFAREAGFGSGRESSLSTLKGTSGSTLMSIESSRDVLSPIASVRLRGSSLSTLGKGVGGRILTSAESSREVLSPIESDSDREISPPMLGNGAIGRTLVNAESSREALPPVGSGSGVGNSSPSSPTISRTVESGRMEMSEEFNLQGNWI